MSITITDGWHDRLHGWGKMAIRSICWGIPLGQWKVAHTVPSVCSFSWICIVLTYIPWLHHLTEWKGPLWADGTNPQNTSKMCAHARTHSPPCTCNGEKTITGNNCGSALIKILLSLPFNVLMGIPVMLNISHNNTVPPSQEPESQTASISMN